MMPHEAIYGFPPPPRVPYELGSVQDLDVERQLKSKDDLELLKEIFVLPTIEYDNIVIMDEGLPI